MITAMLVLVHKKQNDIKSCKIAKLKFVKELEKHLNFTHQCSIYKLKKI